MLTLTAQCEIERPQADVFAVISNPVEIKAAIPTVVNVEILSQHTTGAGLRFREHRNISGHESQSVIEITEYAPPTQVTLLSNEAGVGWESVFTLSEIDSGTRFDLTMTQIQKEDAAVALPETIIALIQSVLDADMIAIKTYCETGS